MEETKAKFDKAEINVDKITQQLQNHQVVLAKDIASLDRMFELNQAYFKELTMYIIAGKLRVQELREKDLAELRTKAEKSSLPEDAQAVNDFTNLIGRFEKKLHDLELTRTISLQMSPQIRMIQNNDLLMTEKIQTAIVNTIPLWKSQMVLGLSMYHPTGRSCRSPSRPSGLPPRRSACRPPPSCRARCRGVWRRCRT